MSGNFGTLIICHIILNAIPILLSVPFYINFFTINYNSLTLPNGNRTIQFHPSIPSGLSFLIKILIIPVLNIGMKILYLKMMRGKEDPDISDMFIGFSKERKLWGNSILLDLCYTLISIGFFLIGFILVGAIAFFAVVRYFSYYSPGNLVIITIISIIGLSCFFSIFFMVRYGFCFYILADKKIGPMAALKESKRITKGHFFRIIYVTFVSFIGWFLLVPLTFGLVLWWIIPYKESVTAALYEELKN